jgi:hypothetical protein
MKFLNFFLFLWFALLDPDPDSGSTDLIESGSEPLVLAAVSAPLTPFLNAGRCVLFTAMLLLSVRCLKRPAQLPFENNNILWPSL